MVSGQVRASTFHRWLIANLGVLRQYRQKAGGVFIKFTRSYAIQLSKLIPVDGFLGLRAAADPEDAQREAQAKKQRDVSGSRHGQR